ncbi:hypothetical protein CAC42_4773 [Sphaceloma murrayae]|uniref:FAD-binding domain-containing protein n=1 Tax=Sphaceloma murrayae TaxID=2082308 RepID=A0A2K1QPC9_9PEZI|nr:hypothetical protein CAC42_4773 [Sphaceloma murrayae]
MAEMQEAGILEDIKKKAMVNNILSFWIGDGPQKKRVAYVEKLEGGKIFPAGLNCPQPILTETIKSYLESMPGTDIRFNQRIETIEQDAADVRISCTNPLDGQRTDYTCNWLVGADGAGSTVRTLLDIPFEGFSWPKEDFCATNIRYPFKKHGFTTANFVMDPVHWGVITVIDDTGLWRCAFGVDAGKTNEEIRKELDEHFKHILPGWPGDGYELVQLNRYKPHQRCASQYRMGRCFLAGDAAHSNNPIGGLGLTTGLLDAGPLGRALAAVTLGEAPERILDHWAEARRTKWLTFTNGFSIENKRMVQRGGYSEDPRGIWKLDDVSAANGMDDWIKMATPDKKQADEAMYKSLEDKQAQVASRMKQWEIALDPEWMAEFEDPAVVAARKALRPSSQVS